jgi:cytochrome c-type biogenesis protein CcmH/NrfG
MTLPITTRLARAALLAFTLSAAPVLAIDTGGGDTSTPPTTSSAKPTKPAGPTLADARADISAKNWTKAITDLKAFVAAHPTSADGFNLLGYSYRNAGNYDLAGKAYAKALKLDPKHTGALEYQGVLFIKLGQMDKAKANLAKIKAISGESSEEYKDLAEAIG